MSKRRIYVGVVVLTLVTLVAAQRAHAIIIVNSLPVEFGPSSLARGESFRFYVSNLATDATAPACDAHVAVYDKMGNTVSESQTRALPGQIGFFDVSFDAFTRTGGTSRISVDSAAINVPFRATAHLVSPGTASETAPGNPDCALTADVFDVLTGRALKINEAEERPGHGGGSGGRGR